MLSASTARLVEGVANLGDPEWVRIKGTDQPVAAQRLVGLSDPDGLSGSGESALVGRRWEMVLAVTRTPDIAQELVRAANGAVARSARQDVAPYRTAWRVAECLEQFIDAAV